MDWRRLYAEARRQGFEMFPAGACLNTVGELETQLLIAVPLMRKLGASGGEEYPAVVEQLIDAWRELADLRGRLGAAEQDASVLTHALVGPMPDDASDLTEGGPDDH